MTPEEVEALTKALQEMHAAEVDVQKAFIEQRPWEERDKAIKKARQTPLCLDFIGSQVLHELARMKRRLTSYAVTSHDEFAFPSSTSSCSEVW